MNPKPQKCPGVMVENDNKHGLLPLGILVCSHCGRIPEGTGASKGNPCARDAQSDSTSAPPAPDALTLATATICFGGGFSYNQIQVRDLKIKVGPYAQYTRAVHVEYIPKGKRKPRAFVQTYRPTLVVLEGHTSVEIPDTFEAPRPGATPGVTVQHGRGMSCDPMWDREFAEALTKSGLKVVADYRGFATSAR